MGNEGKSIKLYDSLQGTWDKSDRQNYQNAFWRKCGQIRDDGNLISRWIQKLSADTKNKTFLEIGTWNGLGSTKVFAESLESRNSDYIFYSLECNIDKSIDAANLYSEYKNVHILNEVLFNKMPSDFNEIYPDVVSYEYLINFNHLGITRQRNIRKHGMSDHWNKVDFVNMERCKLFLDRDNLPDIFDVVLLDGGVYTTYFDFQILKNKCNYLLLDDIKIAKNEKIVEIIKDNLTYWDILEEDLSSRNGHLVCKRIV